MNNINFQGNNNIITINSICDKCSTKLSTEKNTSLNSSILDIMKKSAIGLAFKSLLEILKEQFRNRLVPSIEAFFRFLSNDNSGFDSGFDSGLVCPIN